MIPAGNALCRTVAMLFWVLACSAQAAGSGRAALGESIYRSGVGASGKPVVATREGGMRAPGKDAACVNCHRRSGFGSKEGRQAVIPPITGRYLFESGSAKGEDRELPYVETMRVGRKPYSAESLARALRQGIDSQGRTLSFLMPRFTLDDTEMKALIAYLNGLDQRKPPGVSDTVLHFATIVTPDADPVKRRGMLDVLERYFADRNMVQMAPLPAMRTSRKMMFMVHRRWQLHVWELSGPAETWESQLKRRLAAEPVVAVISGLGGRNWAPVHAFCEHQGVPCLFPNVEAPPDDADRDFYSVYFSKGVLLEAELIASRLVDAAGAKPPASVAQIYRAGDSGEVAAKALAAALKRHGIAVHEQALAAGGAPQAQEVGEAVRGAAGAEALVLWLRPADVAMIDDAAPAPAVVYMSGLMAGLEQAPLPAGWREQTRLAYPVDLPERRRVRVDFPLGWFRIRHIPVVAEQVQADTYLACGLVAETLSHMADSFVRDYLVERLQDTIEHRIITGYYPHLTLASGQRFASKGGYMVRFSEPQGSRVKADDGWLVP
jgi:hypothetical protein